MLEPQSRMTSLFDCERAARLDNARLSDDGLLFHECLALPDCELECYQ